MSTPGVLVLISIIAAFMGQVLVAAALFLMAMSMVKR